MALQKIAEQVKKGWRQMFPPLDHNDLFGTVERRLQFVVTLSIFFPVLISTFLKANGTADEAVNSTALTWFGLISAFLVAYLCLQIGKRNIPAWVIQSIGWLLLLWIFFLITPVIYLTPVPKNQTPPAWIAWANVSLFRISLDGLQYTTIAVFFLAIIGLCWGSARPASRDKK